MSGTPGLIACGFQWWFQDKKVRGWAGDQVPSGLPRATCQAPGAEQGLTAELGGLRNRWVMDELTFESDWGWQGPPLDGSFG